MKSLFFIILLVASALSMFSQTMKVAILDFENTSGKTEYDPLGKAISSMLISDLANNIHPKKVEFFERSQLNKLLDEQKLQKSKNFDTKTAVDFGKMSGVNYVFVGSIFVLEGTCNFSSKLVDVQTSKILLAKDVSGAVESWLQLKSQLAEAIANQINNPISLDPSYKSQSTTLVTLNQYGKILLSMDGGDMDKAEQLRSVFEETTPDFKYFIDIKDEIEKLKQRVSELENVADILTDNFDLGDKAEMKGDFKSAIKYFEKFISNPGDQGFVENKKLYAYSKLARCQFLLGDYANALINSRNAQLIYKFFPEANETELMALLKLNLDKEANEKYYFIADSLALRNEGDFARNQANRSLVWTSGFGIYRGLQTEASADAWFYEGIENSGYGSPPKNELLIQKILNDNKLKVSASRQSLSRYERLESELLSYEDTLLFSSDNILNFYRLSLGYANEILGSGDLKKYEKHLMKEIKRMEAFGVSSEIGYSRIPLAPSRDSIKQKSWENSNAIMSRLGLSTGYGEFDRDFHTIYGLFVFKFLIFLVENRRVEDAANLYNKILIGDVNNTSSYFYKNRWDLILGLRTRNSDGDLNDPLTQEQIMKSIDIMVESALKLDEISSEFWTDVKYYNRENKSSEDYFEIDENIVSNNLIWSRNISLTKDGEGNVFRIAGVKDIKRYCKDSIPACCYYDFNDGNGEAYGMLYNFMAFKLLMENPPKGWRTPSFTDYAHALGFTIEDMNNAVQLFTKCKAFKPSGQWYGVDFCCKNDIGFYWVDQLGVSGSYRNLVLNPTYEVRFMEMNNEDCYFAIRLVKSK